MAGTVATAVVVIGGVKSILNESGQVVDAFQNLMKGHGRHNLVMGSAQVGDQLLYEERTRQSPGGLFSYRTYDFQYNCQGNERISCVVVRDNWDDDTGGNPEKIGGGPNQRYVNIRVTAQMGRGMDFSFYVYGQK